MWTELFCPEPRTTFTCSPSLSELEICEINNRLIQLTDHYTGYVKLKIIVQPAEETFSIIVHKKKITETSMFMTRHTVLGSDPKEAAGPDLTTYYLTVNIPEKPKPFKMITYLCVDNTMNPLHPIVHVLDKFYKPLRPFNGLDASLDQRYHPRRYPIRVHLML
jgi:hypothetical protein